MEESNKRETKKYAQKEIVYSSPYNIYIICIILVPFFLVYVLYLSGAP